MRPRSGRIERLEPASTSAETPRERERRRARPTQAERDRRVRRRKRVALGCMTVIAVVLLVGVAAGVYYWKNFESRVQAGMQDADANAIPILKEPEQRGDPFYMIIMGVDNREGETRARSDTLIVARVDPQTRTSVLISIPRDTRVTIPGHGTQKINAANALGGPALVIETVRDFTGLPISHYVEIDFNGFKDIVDALGGVTVNVPQKIQDPKAGNYDPAAYTIYAGEQVLNGAQSLTFVRSRDFPQGDIARIQNQQIFIKALLRETLQVANVLRLPSIVNAVANNITTDMSVTQLLSLGNDMKGMDDTALATITMPGEPKYIGGVSYVIADEEALAQLVERIEQGLPPDQVVDAEGTPLPGSISVTVRNGAGVGGVAADASSRLRRSGFDVGEVGNMNQFVYDETLVVHKDAAEEAQVVADSLGKGKVVASRGMYSFSTDILLVVGDDWGAPRVRNTHQIPID